MNNYDGFVSLMTDAGWSLEEIEDAWHELIVADVQARG